MTNLIGQIATQSQILLKNIFVELAPGLRRGLTGQITQGAASKIETNKVKSTKQSKLSDANQWSFKAISKLEFKILRAMELLEILKHK